MKKDIIDAVNSTESYEYENAHTQKDSKSSIYNQLLPNAIIDTKNYSRDDLKYQKYKINNSCNKILKVNEILNNYKEYNNVDLKRTNSSPIDNAASNKNETKNNILSINKKELLILTNSPNLKRRTSNYNFSNYSDEDNQIFDIKNLEEKNCYYRYFSPIKAGSLRGSFISIASLTFGGGCLSFPYALSKSGPLLGLLIFITMASLSYLTLKYLLDNGFKYKIMGYNELIEYRLGSKWRYAADISNLISCVGTLISYQYIISALCLQVLNYYFETPCSGYFKLIQIVIVAVVFQIPLSMLKDISHLQYVSIIGTITLGLSIIVIIIECPFYFIQEYNKNNSNPISLFPPKNSNIDLRFSWIDTFGILFFGFASHTGIFQPFQELNRPGRRRLYKVLNKSFQIESILYILLTIAGFLSTFYDTPDVFLKRKNLKGFDDYFIIIVRILLVLTMNSCIAVNFNVLRMSVKSLILGNNPSKKKDFVFIITTYIVTNAITYFVQNAGSLLSFISGVSLTLIAFVVPILIEIKSNKEEKKTLKIIFNYIFLLIICIISIICIAKSGYDMVTSKITENNCL